MKRKCVCGRPAIGTSLYTGKPVCDRYAMCQPKDVKYWLTRKGKAA